MSATASGGRAWIARLLPAIVTAGVAGCAAPAPLGPTVLAVPAKGENFTVFQQHDVTCRQYAAGQVGGQSPGQAAARSGVAGAAVGTGVGAAAGALIGSATGHAGAGAAIGAGGGLLAGTALGAGAGRNVAASTQSRYNNAYTQCMIANGEQIAPPAPPPPRVAYVAPPPVVYAVPPAVVYAAPPAGVAYVPVVPLPARP
ncbi:Glycine zipper family protein [Rhodovastum atsumiense]|uniref:Glycine zipper family protein n=1 Tax=Rhodovastum atsumiense TaxID=504468 RepID=A0A5M6IJ91_9PROT|nr:glycine zipper family protein [Rhodovastum atsumiense]KAA5608212.1 glycine zipper family protein [Rhodovastum atsumiense]CAH2602275.1 Glycine zipper family protein [Rhodovastum atsumiense]